MPCTRADVVRVARTYIGTPFHHLGRQPGVALDCAGLPICVAWELGSWERTFNISDYSFLPNGSLLGLLRQHLAEISRDQVQVGDLVAVTLDKDPQHLCIIGNWHEGSPSVIHACNTIKPERVVEHGLLYSRNWKFSAAFRFPGVID